MPTLIRPTNQPNRNRELIGMYLKDKRLALGLSQQEMLDRIGSDSWFTAWSNVETGQRNLPPHLWEKVAKALGIPTQQFAKVMLRYTHPWAYGCLFGFDDTLRLELEHIPDRYDDVRQHREPRTQRRHRRTA
jgi:transcriptional regulator with XRE-family HTH domain